MTKLPLKLPRLIGYADRPLSKGLATPSSMGLPYGILLSTTDVDDDQEAGALVATLSVENGGGWTFELLDDGDGAFALSGSNLVVGVAGLDHDTSPAPEIKIRAVSATRTLSRTVTMNVRRPLPALPMANGAKLLNLSHSFGQRGAFTNNKGVQSGAVRAALPWIRQWDHRFNMDMWYDEALPWMTSTNRIGGSHSSVGGDHIVAEGGAPGTITRTPWVIARQPGIVYLDIGTNDISSGVGVTSAAHVIERLDRQLALLRNAGIWTVIQTVTDRGAWPVGDAKQTIVEGVNDWIKAQATRSGVKVCDLTGLGFNYPLFDASLFGGDVLHPNPKGGRAIATALLPILQTMVTAGDTRNLDPTSGNLWPSYGLLGTTGTISATYGSGQVATGHRVVRNGGTAVSALCSKEAIDGTSEKQVVAFTSTGAGTRGENWRFTYGSSALLFSAIGVAEGDWLEELMYVELSPWDGWLSISALVELYETGTLRASSGAGFVNPDSSTQDLPLTDGWAGWIRVMPTQVTDAANRIRLDSRPLSIDIDATKAGTGILKVSKPILRKVTDPRGAWNLAG